MNEVEIVGLRIKSLENEVDKEERKLIRLKKLKDIGVEKRLGWDKKNKVIEEKIILKLGLKKVKYEEERMRIGKIEYDEWYDMIKSIGNLKKEMRKKKKRI